MTHIHYHNDFTVPICLVSDSITINPDIICSITFYTRNNGNLYRCCRACNTLYVDENNVIAVLNAHNLEPGVLKYMVEYQIPDSKYPDGYQKICQHYTSNIDLTTQNGDITIAEAQIIYGDTIRELIESAGYSYTKEEVDEMIEGISAQVNTYTKPEIDSKLSTKANTADVYDKTTIDGMFENIDLPDNVVTDANYVHTDNNFTTAYKNVIDGLPDSITTEELTVTTSVSSKEMVFTPYYLDVPENNKIGLNVAFDEDNERSVFEFYDYYSHAILSLPIIDGAEFVTTAGFPIKETNADGSGTTQSSALKPCTYNVLQVRNTRVRTINFSFTQGNTSYYLLIDNSYLSGFPALTSLNFEDITITWEGGNAFDLATFRSGTDAYAIINLLKISDEVILGNYKLY